jgi:outer membrane protein assembly factor BamD (BamD/ComL family)
LPDVTPPPVVETTHATRHVAEPPPATPHVAAPSARAAPNPSIATAPSQAALLARAWSALESGAADRALELSRRDEQLHPDGALREEREALAVVALAKLQRHRDAAAAASQFINDHPASVHRALVERSLRSRP